MDRDIRKVDWNDTTNGKSLSSELDYLIANSAVLSLASRIYWALRIIQYIYYPVLAIVGVPVNSTACISDTYIYVGRLIAFGANVENMVG
ncbi:hypothetical protein scyTo_0006236 [Scyliorhinus torazame]|uniref:Uncharacterized protein n=1 Tax=Scyliorhinus torazame TaxID=75743 RepID=A0A401PGN4_SCYTO|nr:hypothetical protein [Scyliorhinus torazame]